MKKIISLLIVVFFFVACSKNEENQSIAGPVYLPKKIKGYDNSTNPPTATYETEYFYNGAKLLSKETESFENGVKQRFVYTYEGDKIVAEVFSVLDNGNWFETSYKYYDYYTNGKIKSLSESRPGIMMTTKFELFYDSSNLVKCIQTSINNVGQVFPGSRSEVIYSGNKVIKTRSFLYNYTTNAYDTNPSTERECEWDSFNSPNRNITGYNELFYYPLYRASNGNLTKETVRNYNDNTTIITNFLRQFNSDGYPISIVNSRANRLTNIEYIQL